MWGWFRPPNYGNIGDDLLLGHHIIHRKSAHCVSVAHHTEHGATRSINSEDDIFHLPIPFRGNNPLEDPWQTVNFTYSSLEPEVSFHGPKVTVWFCIHRHDGFGLKVWCSNGGFQWKSESRLGPCHYKGIDGTRGPEPSQRSWTVMMVNLGVQSAPSTPCAKRPTIHRKRAVSRCLSHFPLPQTSWKYAKISWTKLRCEWKQIGNA